jgi:CRISPR-associated endonuclease/helicase Cas3
VALLRAAGIEASLFHARFAMGDRLAIERQIVRRFGKGDPVARPGVLVATQVIEQSLDLDFDLLVSDLAPVDLLLQRAGRLWRHPERPRPIPGPRMLVVSPDPAAEIGKDWYAVAFPRAACVYRNHALLWLSANALFAHGPIRVPGDVAAWSRRSMAVIPTTGCQRL